jgi:hypothetical protein
MVGANSDHGGSDDGTEHLDEAGRGGARRSDRLDDDSTDDRSTGHQEPAGHAMPRDSHRGTGVSSSEGAIDGKR